MISVIIPAYNNWPLTHTCLRTIAPDAPSDMEVLVVDNASSDDTPAACPVAGKRLFGERFRYLRQESNRNFAGACNVGAQAATGEYVYFLNNDTESRPGWHEPLLRAFAANSTLGAVGPLLTYPPDTFDVERVQHVGITFSPERRVSHLYEFYPADHALVGKERFFQAITAAALCVPKGLFLSVGGFDEGFVNGFEDVELCRRIGRAGWKLSVAPEARVRHLCGQSAGRTACEQANARRLTELCSDIVPDKGALVRADGYELRLSEWLTFEIVPPRQRLRELAPLLRDPTATSLLKGLAQEPYWVEGSLALGEVFLKGGLPAKALELWHLQTQFTDTPETLLPLWRLACRLKVADCFEGLAQALRRHVLSREDRIKRLRDLRRRFRQEDPQLASDADSHLAAEERFFAERMAPLIRELHSATT